MSVPGGLGERIETAVAERLEEAVEFVCMDLLVQLRRTHGRPAPQAGNARDKGEYEGLVREWLLHLRSTLLDCLPPEAVQKVNQAEETGSREETLRLLAGQVALARTLPDYWQRFETLRAAFTQARLAAPRRRSRLWPFRR
jgi:hypothetical protein